MEEELKRKPAPFITVTVPMRPWFQAAMNEKAAELAKTGEGSFSHYLLDLAVQHMNSRGILGKLAKPIEIETPKKMKLYTEWESWKSIKPEGGKTTPFTAREQHDVFSVYVPHRTTWLKEKLKRAATIKVKVKNKMEEKYSVSKFLWNLFFIANKDRILTLQKVHNRGKPLHELKDYPKDWLEYLGRYEGYLTGLESGQPYSKDTGKNAVQKVAQSATASTKAKKKTR
jgi:hypothetical protein